MNTDFLTKLDPFRLFHLGRKQRPYSKYARFNRRMLAATIDSILLLLALPLVNRLAPVNMQALENYTVDPEDPQAARHFLMYALGNQPFLQSWFENFFLQMLAWCVFSALCLHFWSATPGKMLLRMKVVNAKTEGRMSDLQVFLRSFGYLLSAAFFGLGFFWIAFNKRRRGWHDYLAGTVVIDQPLPWRKEKVAP